MAHPQHDLKPLIVERIANGHLIAEICADIGVDRTAIWRWQQADEDFATQCARAREASASVTEERVEAVLREVRAKELEPDQARVILNGLTWLAKVRAPKVYGDNVRIDGTVTVGLARVLAGLNGGAGNALALEDGRAGVVCEGSSRRIADEPATAGE